ncbi:IclR family transcriptional regulator C-terminal domain-containing protein [Nonomuraea sp. NPDC050556]|uniref:IclR family transcriptional regulator domain-containing protein n=1 Tax=Nonomuraea sp. NPDC050556 TaxID=3364369 RepID=UPI003798DD2B
MSMPPEVVGPLVRGLSVLRALAAAGGRRRVSELARETGLARSAADRVVSTLSQLGYLRLDGGAASMAPRLMELGNAYLAACRVPARLGPLAERLATELDESVVLAVPDGGGLRLVYRSATRRAMSASFGVGDIVCLDEPGLVAVSACTSDGVVVSVVGAQPLGSAVRRRLEETVAEMEAAPYAEDEEPAWEPRGPLGPGANESLARGLAVLATLDRPRTLSGAAQVTGLAPATVRRSLITLEHLGYVAASGRLFAPTPRVLDLGFAPLSRLTFEQLARPHLEELVARVHESASAAVLCGPDIQYVARVPTVRIMSVNLMVGTRLPAHCTAMGRVLLAGLPADRRLDGIHPRALTPRTVTSPDALGELLDQVARDGYALVDGELEEGLRSVAVPVRGRGGEVVAAINVAMHAGLPMDAGLLPNLLAAAAAIEADLRVAVRAAGRPGSVWW